MPTQPARFTPRSRRSPRHTIATPAVLAALACALAGARWALADDGRSTSAADAGPAQRLGAGIDRAVDDLRASISSWYGRTREKAGGASADAAARARRWYEGARLEVLGDPTAPRTSRTLMARAVDPATGAPWDPASGSTPDVAWIDAAAVKGGLPSRVVVLVHGLDEPGSVWADLAPQLLIAGHSAVRFDYPNDAPAAESADALAECLCTLAGAGVRRVTIVGHSMGGLLGRDVLTRPEHYAGAPGPANGLPRLERLIVIAAPNDGCALACLEPVGEAREQIARRLDGTQAPGAGLVHSYADGAGEAAADLAPRSAYLAALNARPAPRGVPVTNVVARVLTPEACRGALESARSLLARVGLDAPDPAALDPLAAALGDGIVSGDSAALPGCEDTVVVAADHRSVIRRWHVLDGLGIDDDARHPAFAPAIPIILDRLAIDAR